MAMTHPDRNWLRSDLWGGGRGGDIQATPRATRNEDFSPVGEDAQSAHTNDIPFVFLKDRHENNTDCSRS